MRKTTNESIACLRPGMDFNFRRDRQDPLQLEKRIRYINKMSIPLTIIGRDGVSYVLPADPVDPVFNKEEVLIVEISIDAGSAVKIDTDQKYTGGTSDTAILASRFISSAGFAGKTVCFQYQIHRKEIVERQQCVYIPDLDLVVTTLNTEQCRVVHPQSSSVALNVATEDIDAFITYTTVKVMLVDNSKIKNRRWIMCGNSPFAIDPVTISTMDDGLYVFSNGNTALDGGKGRTEQIYYTWQELESGKFGDKPPLKIYCTYEEALRYGDEDTQQEIELKAVQRELVEAKLKLEALKNENETKRTLLDTETAENKVEREKKSLEIKDHYEERSNRRREESDAMKHSLQWGAFAISVIGLVVGVLGHFKTKK